MKDLIVTQRFRQVYNNQSPGGKEQLMQMLKMRVALFASLYEQDGAVEFVKGFYEMFDESIAVVLAGKDGAGISCKKGCHACCRQNVDVYEGEVKLIVEFCKENGIDIPKEYLKKQLKYGIKEVSKSDVGWCTFLKNGECSIYSARPLLCRNYFVASPPEMCDVIKFPPPKFKVSWVVFTLPELDVCAFCSVMSSKGKDGRLPELLLPYSK